MEEGNRIFAFDPNAEPYAQYTSYTPQFYHASGATGPYQPGELFFSIGPYFGPPLKGKLLFQKTVNFQPDERRLWSEPIGTWINENYIVDVHCFTDHIIFKRNEIEFIWLLSETKENEEYESREPRRIMNFKVKKENGNWKIYATQQIKWIKVADKILKRRNSGMGSFFFCLAVSAATMIYGYHKWLIKNDKTILQDLFDDGNKLHSKYFRRNRK